jgi:hypothetical protein
LKVLLVLLTMIVVAIGVVGQVERLSRTAEARVEIVAVEFQAGEAYRSIPRGWNVRYRFETGGRSYDGATFRQWSLETIKQAKVCYDPSDPRNQVLVLPTASCP